MYNIRAEKYIYNKCISQIFPKLKIHMEPRPRSRNRIGPAFKGFVCAGKVDATMMTKMVALEGREKGSQSAAGDSVCLEPWVLAPRTHDVTAKG